MGRPLVFPRALALVSTRTRAASSSRYSSASTRTSPSTPKRSCTAATSPSRPITLPGVGPSACTYSISGCAPSCSRRVRWRRRSSARGLGFSDMGLAPFGGEAFGGGAGLVDVGVVRLPRNRALFPHANRRVPESNGPAAAGRTCVEDDHGKGDSAAEVNNLLGFCFRRLVSAPPVFKEATNRRPPFVHLQPHRRRVPDGVRGEEARHRTNIAAGHDVNSAAHELDQIGRRGLLGHHGPVSRCWGCAPTR